MPVAYVLNGRRMLEVPTPCPAPFLTRKFAVLRNRLFSLGIVA